uniref:MET_1 protein n=2 Tax=Fopius arisanus TaxID=64838 RepID=A0A0C9RNL0_9HYME
MKTCANWCSPTPSNILEMCTPSTQAIQWWLIARGLSNIHSYFYNMTVVIDIEGFKNFGNEFVVKEFAISALELDGDGKFVHVAVLVDPPHEWDELLPKYKEVNQWLSRHYHGLHWNTPGDIKYETLSEYVNNIVKNVSHIYVQGAEKKNWLQQILKNEVTIEDFNDFGSPDMEPLEGEGVFKCVYHHSLFDGSSTQYHCPLEHVQRLKKWFTKYNAGSLEKSLKKYCETQHLNALTTQEIAFLPKHFIKTIAKDTVDAAWDKLPEMMKRDPNIAKLRYCRTHWSSISPSSLNPIPPPIAKCPLCLYHR